jgi:hypothetical protein
LIAKEPCREAKIGIKNALQGAALLNADHFSNHHCVHFHSLFQIIASALRGLPN